jgi:predicted nucleotidyltransferase
MRPSEALAAHRDQLRELVGKYDVRRPRVFGSVLTGADTEGSDLDLLVDRGEATTLFTIAGLEHQAGELLGCPVSVLTPAFLPVKFRETVLREARLL